MQHVPNLFLIGTAKGGSTTLAYQLTSHPEITFASEKEPNIFNGTDPDACRARLTKAMDSVATVARAPRYILDASVNYSQFPKEQNIPAHIAEICGTDAPRFLYMLRNPVDRAVSQYFWRCERYGEDRSIREAITPESQYVMSSRYDLQIEQYLAHFPATHLKVILHDDYFADVAKGFGAICRWLDLDDSHRPDQNLHRGATRKDTTRAARFPALNRLVRSSARLRGLMKTLLPHEQQLKLTQMLSREVPRETLDPKCRAEMVGWFADSITHTEELTGHDLSSWRT